MSGKKSKSNSGLSSIDFAVLSLVVFFLVALLGTVSDILVFDDAAWQLTCVSLFITITLCILIVLFFQLEKKAGHAASNGSPNTKGVQDIKAALALATLGPIMTFSFVYGAVVGAIPAILHPLFSQPAELTVTVRHKPHSYYGNKSCSGKVFIEQFNFLMVEDLCGIRKQDWDALTPGMPILLFGEMSWFGFTADEYSTRQLVYPNT